MSKKRIIEKGYADVTKDMASPDYDFASLSTPDLLRLLHTCRVNLSYEAEYVVGGVDHMIVAQSLIKKELAKRPNIPTKAQGKEKRLAKAKEQKNRW